MRPDPAPSREPRAAGRRAQRRRRRVAAAAVVAVAGTVVGGIGVADDVQRAAAVIAADRPMVASGTTVLADLWRNHRETHLEPGTGRALDARDGAVTTSRAQAHTMLRAVWADDPATFAQSWQWAQDNLQRDDALLASRFGPRPDGSYGIQDDLGGGRSVTGADVDAAFALLMAYSRWQEDDHLYDAVPLIDAIWERSVVRVDGEPVLGADDLQRDRDDAVLVSTSHLAPYAFRVFARVDPDHDWRGLLDRSYALLDELARQTPGTAGLPPDRVELDRRTGEPDAVAGEEPGAEALELSWRLALDSAWHGDERALRLLEQQSALADSWTGPDRSATASGRDGTPAAGDASPAWYGRAMGYFTTVRPDLADDVYTDELLSHYDTDTGDLAGQLDGDDANWVWFGMALHLDQLPDLNAPEE